MPLYSVAVLKATTGAPSVGAAARGAERVTPPTLFRLPHKDSQDASRRAPRPSPEAQLVARGLSANRLALDLGVPSGRITDILNGRRGITADTAVRLGRYLGNRPQFRLDLQSQYEIALVERERGSEIAQRVRPADAA